MLFTYATAVRLSIFRRMFKQVSDFRKDFTARKTARNSRHFIRRFFIWLTKAFLCGDLERMLSSLSRRRLVHWKVCFSTTRLLPFQLFLFTHHESSSLASSESGPRVSYAYPPSSSWESFICISLQRVVFGWPLVRLSSVCQVGVTPLMLWEELEPLGVWRL